MGALDTIGQIAGGLNYGIGNGMDLAERYNSIQDKNKERTKRDAFEQEAMKLVQYPAYKDDPIGLSGGLADAALKVGDWDGYDKWTQAANSARNLKVQKLGMSAFAKARINPEAAIGDINEMFKAFGNNNNIGVQRTPTGMRLNFNVDGQNYTTDYAAADHDKFEHDILSMMEGYVMKPDDLGKLEVERGKADAYKSNLQSEMAARDAELPSKIAENKAQATSALAQAAAANERIADSQARRPLELANLKTQGEYTQKLTENVGVTPKAAPKTSAQIIDDLVASSSNELGLDDTGLGTDKMFLGGVAKDLRDANPELGEEGAAYTAYSMTQLNPQQISQLAQMNVEDAKAKGVIAMPNGTVVPYSDALVAKIGQIIAKAGAGAE